MRALHFPFRPTARALRQRAAIERRADFVVPPTPADRLGPAYRKGAPFRSVLVAEDDATRLLLTGRVLSANTGKPLPGALLDVWQTDTRGVYSNLFGLPWRRRSERGMAYRGRLHADADGAFRIETVFPGHYPLGPFSRPRHIHFQITHPGHRALITQLYFANDPLLGRDRFARPELILAPAKRQGDDGTSVHAAQFDFVLIEDEGR